MLSRSIVLAVIVVASCSPTLDALDPEEALAAQDASPVVGGKREDRFPAVGYLMIGESAQALRGPSCGATLVGSRTAVTAAHCIRLSNATHFGIGFGSAGSGRAHPARAVVVHPAYDLRGEKRYQHDLAVLALDVPVDGVEPAKVRAVSEGAHVTYVGYGRVSEGGYEVNEGYTNERKSATEDVTSVDGLNVFVTGQSGGLCWGDSGGPILDEATGEISGVLADFDRVFSCSVGNKMIFTSLVAEQAFLDRALACASADDFTACMR